MAYTPHLKVKPKVLAEGAVEALQDRLAISNTVTKRSDAKTFYRSEGDTITHRVKGTLPVRQYAPRNDRSKPIVTDTYSETTVDVKISQERPYSAIKLTDEQKDWDYQDGWGDITEAQIDTLGEYLENGTLNQILSAPYERHVLVQDDAAGKTAAKEANQDIFFNAVVEAKMALKLMRTPNEKLYALVGVGMATELIQSNKLVKNQGTGDSALSSDVIGTLAGVDFIMSTHVPSDQAILYASSGFLTFTGAPSIPQSVPFGATASANGWALRWLMDYDTGFLTDRSVFDTYAGHAYTRDHIAVFNGESQHIVSDEEFFVRGVKLGMKSGGSLTAKEPGDGKTDTPGGAPASFLAKAYNMSTVSTTTPEGQAWPLGGNGYTDVDDGIDPTYDTTPV